MNIRMQVFLQTKKKYKVLKKSKLNAVIYQLKLPSKTQEHKQSVIWVYDSETNMLHCHI